MKDGEVDEQEKKKTRRTGTTNRGSKDREIRWIQNHRTLKYSDSAAVETHIHAHILWALMELVFNMRMLVFANDGTQNRTKSIQNVKPFVMYFLF